MDPQELKNRILNQGIRVAIVDNSIDPRIYNPVAHWKAYLDGAWKAFRAPEGELPSLTGGFSHVILTGSETTIMQRPDWVLREIDFVREAFTRGIPILGSCYGHQLMALALSGERCVRRCPEPEMGWLSIRITIGDDILGRQGEFYAFTLHFDEVIDLGEEYIILAETADCHIHAFRYRGKPVWGIQSHPEIDIPAGKQLLMALMAMGTEATNRFRSALLSRPLDSGLITGIVDRFLKAS